MERQRKNIDRTLPERHRILRLLERLTREGITINEMDEIGTKLCASGRRALSPLVRKLWRERSGDLISRYTYLLDFFEDESWLDQLVQIALRRRDLEEGGKAAILAALDGYGVDVRMPPFSRLLAEAGGPLRQTLPRLFDRGEEGIICFVEDFLLSSPEARTALIRELPSVDDPRVIRLAEVLLGIDDEAVVRETVVALGKIRMSTAAALLHSVAESEDAVAGELARRSLRRLAFLAVAADRRPALPSLPLGECYAGAVDGAGKRVLWLSRRREGGAMAALCLEIHETRGMTAAWGRDDLGEEECARHLAEVGDADELVRVAPEYTLLLIGDACCRSRERGAYLPAEFYVLQAGMFRPGEIVAAPYTPDFRAFTPERLAASPRLVADSAALLDDDLLAGWFVSSPRVYDFAEEWMTLEEEGGTGKMARGLDGIVMRFCRDILLPEAEKFRCRLLLTADLMRHAGRSRELVEKTVAVAALLDLPGLYPWNHPFFRRLALESMHIAREALAEGYDLRLHPDCSDEEEWE